MGKMELYLTMKELQLGYWIHFDAAQLNEQLLLQQSQKVVNNVN